LVSISAFNILQSNELAATVSINDLLSELLKNTNHKWLTAVHSLYRGNAHSRREEVAWLLLAADSVCDRLQATTKHAKQKNCNKIYT